MIHGLDLQSTLGCLCPVPEPNPLQTMYSHLSFVGHARSDAYSTEKNQGVESQAWQAKVCLTECQSPRQEALVVPVTSVVLALALALGIRARRLDGKFRAPRAVGRGASSHGGKSVLVVLHHSHCNGVVV